MAWRIGESVQRGEIDNRQREIVRGRLWLHGLPDPVEIELCGNACQDLAGCLLTFENPEPTKPLHGAEGFALIQRGAAGELTASRKVRIVPPPPGRPQGGGKSDAAQGEQVANCLYLEWFSETNGRVVLEHIGCRLAISAPEWALSSDEDEERGEKSMEAFAQFMDQLSEAIEAKRESLPEDREWDEFDYERFLQASDASTSQYMELLERYRDHPDRERIAAEEMGWAWPEEEMETEIHDSGEMEGPWDDEGLDLPDLEPDPMTEGVVWIKASDGQIGHPLYFRAHDGSLALWHACESLSPSRTDDPDVSELLGEYQITGSKLAGALNPLAYRGEMTEGAFIVAYLKRALHHLHIAQAALERVAARKILPVELLVPARAELFGIREEVLRLMEEYRKL